MYILKRILKEIKNIRIFLVAKIRQKQITIKSLNAIRLHIWVHLGLYITCFFFLFKKFIEVL